VLWFKLHHRNLFIRHFYEDFFTHVLGEFDGAKSAGNVTKFAVVGSPGIGKSASGMFLLWKAVCAGKTVVYVQGIGEAVYIFSSKGQVYQGNYLTWKSLPELASPHTVLLLDEAPMIDRRAFSVLLTSPRGKNTRAMRDLPSRTMFFPMLSQDELLDMRSSCYPNTSSKEVEEVSNLWGGSARLCFQHTALSRQRELSKCVFKANLNRVRQWLETGEVLDGDFGSPNDHEVEVSSNMFRIYCAGESKDGPPTTSPDYYEAETTEFGTEAMATKYLYSKQSALRAREAAMVESI
jgi:hypothetical protein